MSETQMRQNGTGYVVAAALILVSLLTAPCLAAERMPTRTGYHIGGSLSDLRGRSSEGKDIDFGPGCSLGMSRSFQVCNEFVFQPELNLILRTTSLKYDYHIGSGFMSFDESATMYYLELPLIAKFPYRWSETFLASVYVGPVWAISLGGRRSGKYTSHLDNFSSDSYSGSIGNLETLDFGVAIGWDFHFGSPTRRYMIDLRFTFGLKSVFADVDDPTSIPDNEYPFCDPITGTGNEYKSGTFMVSFGFDFPE